MSSELAMVIADMPGVAQDLLRKHRRTAEGRCPVCTAGPQGAHVVHPCTVYAAAASALTEITRRRS
ncbi:MAG: hypothetical protein JNM77_13820 [Pseudonocardia sp.]|nr:hypothetical protein [Pseudonocardia sp.]